MLIAFLLSSFVWDYIGVGICILKKTHKGKKIMLNIIEAKNVWFTLIILFILKQNTNEFIFNLFDFHYIKD